MISAIELEKYVADASILGVVIGKLHYGKKPCLIILFKVDKGLAIDFFYIILPFDLTICLWIEGGGKSPLYAEKIA